MGLGPALECGWYPVMLHWRKLIFPLLVVINCRELLVRDDTPCSLPSVRAGSHLAWTCAGPICVTMVLFIGSAGIFKWFDLLRALFKQPQLPLVNVCNRQTISRNLEKEENEKEWMYFVEGGRKGRKRVADARQRTQGEWTRKVVRGWRSDTFLQLYVQAPHWTLPSGQDSEPWETNSLSENISGLFLCEHSGFPQNVFI